MQKHNQVIVFLIRNVKSLLVAMRGGKSCAKLYAMSFCWVSPSVQGELVLTGNFRGLSKWVWFWFYVAESAGIGLPPANVSAGLAKPHCNLCAGLGTHSPQGNMSNPHQLPDLAAGSLLGWLLTPFLLHAPAHQLTHLVG